ncbi:hypothetical protein ACVRW7_03080 [Streptococcus ratti]|uniref:hypothetical protein n=1 Tax=Streptococcus ratti TaxID=1341 RepID=UPI0002BDED43|nr:hypothetical protein [Streptococcus ratti]EMP69535.1 hypothetical protein D822_07658 [Streptococcus ratti FA-1 = DSM 20564]QEY07315.1 hypothetical protein FY406_06540 [Streptococcus ratti]VEI59752.1 PTS transporter [Streptococcus mutans]
MSQQLYKEAKKADNQQLKQKISLKNNLFSRYLLFRYSLALFFFVNLYWILSLIYRPSAYFILPVILLFLIIAACAEQFKLYGAKEVYLEQTKRALKAQISVELLLLAVTMIPRQLPAVVPFFSDTVPAHIFFALVQLLGLLICCYNLRRIRQINNNEDKFYSRFHNHIEKYI